MILTLEIYSTKLSKYSSSSLYQALTTLMRWLYQELSLGFVSQLMDLEELAALLTEIDNIQIQHL
ncbi:MAG: hypothetical protein RMY34_19795 [Aulosira sp. DedQUE10]|nr:hypothetical protein [Aulosira sp. DedQUE10]